jgi:riboflavin kinase / FMN adenylyltransferase
MQHSWSLDPLQLKNSWVTIGSFDGVHRGHQAIVEKLCAGAHSVGSQAVVLTFYPHPSIVLGKRKDPVYLTGPEERAELLGKLGADYVVTHPFNHEVAAMSARDFVMLMHKHLGMQKLLVGYDFALGRGREGDVPALTRLGEEFGFSVDVMPAVNTDGEVVSSSQIRNLLLEGQVEAAAARLNRPYSITGEVAVGAGRGRMIGIPTANLKVWDELVIPKNGVYACRVEIHGQTYQAVTNIGVRPTFEQENLIPSVEAHVLNFDRDLYGQDIRLEFWFRIRDERRFENFQSLVDQIRLDITTARTMLAVVTNP